ncbi:FAD-dependent monooxygenase [Amycolatopsis minnesotensis]|uniref:FAD-dependent monooxygenase n=1 Tax=Amycolatopsis minnesotensis TaxID=337894 RepID=A0ABN2SMY6_9PSEU
MHVLISGAGIAGPTLAHRLSRLGIRSTVVERSDGRRGGGGPIDLRGRTVELAGRMGILNEVEAVRTHTEGVSFVDADGRTVLAVDPAVSGDLELERDDLVRILHDATRNDVEYVFDDSIRALAQDDAGVDVEFERGAPRRFDLVLGADGLHSTVRRLVFGPESSFARYLGLYSASVGVDPGLGRENRGVLHQEPGRTAGVYSYRGKAAAFFAFRPREFPGDLRETAQQKKLVTEAYAGMGWQVPKLLAELEAAEGIYADAVSQIHLPSWSAGRVALLGDAAYCASFLTGMGTSLAMLGADALAEGLATGDHRAAFARYEEAFRPEVTRHQAGIDESAARVVLPHAVEHAI